MKLSAIGDVLMATPVARALRKANPEAYIAWIVETKSADVVMGNPYLDEVIVWNRKGQGGVIGFLKGLFQLGKQLRALKFDACIDLQGLIRSAVVSLVSGAPRRIGFADGEEGSVFLYNEKYDPRPDDPNAQQRNLDLLKVIGIESQDTAMDMPLSDDDRAFADRFFQENGLDGERVIAFFPATTWDNKHWVEEGWSQVADILGEKYGAKTVIMGSRADVALAVRIIDRSAYKPIISAGKTTLKQAGAIMDKCTAVIGVDTGLLHMAVALDRPAVGLFGASAWRCFLKKENFVWVAKDFPCSPCRRHPTCSNVDCMRAITPEDVEVAVAPWLNHMVIEK